MVNLYYEFVSQRLIIDDALTNGDYKANNKAMKALIKIYKEFEKNIAQATTLLSELLKHENDCVRSGAAAHCLALGILLEQSQTVLLDLSNNAKNKVVAFKAKATLEVWRKQGYLNMYPEKKKK